MKKLLPHIITFIISLFTISFSVQAQVYVNANATGANDGSSWTDAYIDLQNALTDPNNSAGIWVATGTYLPSVAFDFDNSSTTETREVTFQIPDGVEVYGGFSGTETAIEDRVDFGVGETNETILSGNIGATGDSLDNAYHVVYTKNVSSLTVIDGFTIRDGNANFDPAFTFIPAINDWGGGWYNDGNGTGNSSSPTLLNCNFIANFARRAGAGMFNNARTEGTTNTNLTDCNFVDNISGEGRGAGIYSDASDPSRNGGTANLILTGCNFINNRSDLNGGAMYSEAELGGTSNSILTNCSFINNYADGFGGAMFNSGASEGNCSPTLINCNFTSNTSRLDGGAIYNEGLEGISNPILTNCNFTENVVTNINSAGGAIYNHGQEGNASPTITNCIFVRNEAPFGAAIANDGDVGSDGPGTSNPIITNCTFIGTSTTGSTIYNIALGLSGVEGEARPVIRNCIFGGNIGSVPSWVNFAGVNATTDIAFSIIPEADEATITSGSYAGTIVGDGMIYDTDPLFVDPATDDFTLQLGSPAIDVGNNDALSNSITTDAAGNPRIFDTTIDLGAFENNDIPFIITVNTVSTGVSPTNDDQFPITTGSSTNTFNVYWEEIGNPANNGLQSNLTGDPVLTFPSQGNYKLSITGDLQRFYFPFGANDAPKLLSVEQWGNIQWTSMNRTFYECANMVYNATDAPDLSNVTDMRQMFDGCTSFNADLNNWNVSGVENMFRTFAESLAFNGNIADWDVGNVGSLKSMFAGASSFNSDISSWDVSSVNNMGAMFLNASTFDQNLGNWNLSAIDATDTNIPSPKGLENMLDNTSLSVANYDSTLIGWSTSTNPIPSEVTLGANNLNFCFAADAKAELTNDFAWTINDAGPACTAPSSQASALSFSAITTNSINISWTNGNGANRIVVAKEAAEVDATPEDLTAYLANASFGSGDEIGTGNFVVYNGNASSFSIIGLEDENTYHFQVFEYNGTAGTDTYNKKTSTGNPASESTIPAAPTISSLAPQSAAQGDTVIIIGTNFANTTAVSFGGTDAASFTVLSNTEIQAVVSQGSSGDVTITTSNGTVSIDGFIFFKPELRLLSFDQNPILNGQAEVINLGIALQEEDLLKEFTIENTGNAELIITDIISSENVFEVLNAPSNISPASEAKLSVRFNTEDLGVYSSEITISNNASNMQDFTFSLRAELAGVNVILNETGSRVSANQSVDIGSTNLGINLDKDFIIENLRTDSAIQVLNVTTDNSVFEVLNIPDSVDKSSTEEFTIRLNANNAGDYQGTVTVTTDINQFSFAVLGEVLPEASREISVFNVITPNGDGRHDVLEIQNISEYPNNTVSIFNRLGNRVFQVKGYNNNSNNFNGVSESGKELITGNYYYVIDKGNGDKRLSGFLLIKR